MAEKSHKGGVCQPSLDSFMDSAITVLNPEIEKDFSSGDIFQYTHEGQDLLSAIFEGHLIRVIIIDGLRWSYVKDVGDAAGLSSGHVSKVIKRIGLTHPHELRTSTLEAIGIKDPKTKHMVAHLLNPSGIVHFFLEIGIEDLLPERKEKVMRFNNWMTDLVGMTLSGELAKATLETMRKSGYHVADTWQEQRAISKSSQGLLMDILKEKYIETHPEKETVPQHIFTNENRMINKVTFGTHEKGIREKMRTDQVKMAELGFHLTTDYAYARLNQNYEERKKLLEEDSQRMQKILAGRKKTKQVC